MIIHYYNMTKAYPSLLLREVAENIVFFFNYLIFRGKLNLKIDKKRQLLLKFLIISVLTIIIYKASLLVKASSCARKSVEWSDSESDSERGMVRAWNGQ